MSVPVLNKRIEMALRIAIAKGGSLSYNPDMYKLGFADNIPPSEKFNKELEKYGNIEYDWGMDDDFGYGSPFSGAWVSFTINEKGRAVIKEIDGFMGYKKILRILGSLLGYALGLGIFCVIAYFIASISEYKEYSWYMGIWHALFVVPNFLLHCFYDSNILYYAKEHTTAYGIFFWLVFVIGIIPGIIRYLKEVLVSILKGWFYK